MGLFIRLAICILAQPLYRLLYLPGEKKTGANIIQRFFGSLLILLIVYS